MLLCFLLWLSHFMCYKNSSNDLFMQKHHPSSLLSLFNSLSVLLNLYIYTQTNPLAPFPLSLSLSLSLSLPLYFLYILHSSFSSFSRSHNFLPPSLSLSFFLSLFLSLYFIPQIFRKQHLI